MRSPSPGRTPLVQAQRQILCTLALFPWQFAREHPQGMELGAGWAAGLDTGQGWCCCGLVHGKCGERAGTWTATSIFYFNPTSKLLLFPCAGGIYSPVFTPAALSSLSHLGMEELFQPLSPKIKEQTLLPAHDRDKSARQEHEDIGMGTKTAEGVPHCQNSCPSKAKPGGKIKVCQGANLSSRSQV